MDERETGTLRRLLVTPTRRATILLGKMLPYFLLSVAQLTLFLLLGSFVFGVRLGSSFLGLAMMVTCSALAVVGLGIMFAALVKSEGQAGGLATLAVLSMAVVSGAMFPSIHIPILEYFTPHYWAMQGFRNLFVLGVGLESVLLPCGVLFGLAIIFFVVGLSRFRFE